MADPPVFKKKTSLSILRAFAAPVNRRQPGRGPPGATASPKTARFLARHRAKARELRTGPQFGRRPCATVTCVANPLEAVRRAELAIEHNRVQ